MPERRPFSLGTVILAAGHSSRMGRPKLLLPWGETTVLGHLLAQWRRLAAAQIAVVCQPQAAALHAELDRLQFSAAQRIANDQPDQGMFNSVQCAAKWTGWIPGVTTFALVLGDQPHLSPATLEEVLAFARRHPDNICQPARKGHGRHPVFLPSANFRELATAGPQTLKQFLAARSDVVKMLELDDPGLDLDLDTPADFEKARELFFGDPRDRAGS